MSAIRGVLVELDGMHAGRRIELPDTLTIGGTQDAVGSWHGGALIERKGPGRYVVKELDPKSPVLVNEDRIATALLSDGVFLKVGTNAYRVFLEHVATPPPSPTPRAHPAPRHAPQRGSVPRAKGTRPQVPQAAIVGLALLVIAAAALLAWMGSRDGREEPVPTHARGPETVRASPTGGTPSPPPATRADIIASVERGVALISSPRGVGTGFLVDDGILATNAHVIEDCYLPDLRVQFPSRGSAKTHVLAILHKDNGRDLCLLRVAKGAPPLRLAESVPFRRGEEVLLIGNPGIGDDIVLENAVTQGLMSSLTTIDGERFIQISASVNPGNSGGPVLNRKGEVLAVATLKAGGVEGIAFGIPATDVSKALRSARHVSEAKAREAESRHSAQVVFLRLARIGAAYLKGLFIHVDAMQSAIDEDLDPSVALWRAKAVCEPIIRMVKEHNEEGLFVHFHAIVRDRALDDALRSNLEALQGCVEEIRKQVEDPHGRIDTYLTVYRQLRIRFASLVSRTAHTLDVGQDIAEELPPER